MIPAAEVKVNLDQEAIRKYIQEQLDQLLRQEYIFVDTNRLARMMNVSKRWMEEYILDDPRIMVHLRQKNRKRLYLYPDVVEAIRDLSEEW